MLADESTIALRDLPAFYANATSLLYKLKEPVAEVPDEIRQLLDAETAPPSRLSLHLIARLETLLSSSEQTNADGIAAMGKQAVHRINQTLSMLSESKTVEMIQALFILPLETRRQQELAALAHQEWNCYFDFYRFHYRDSSEAYILALPKRDKLTSIEERLG